jgi:HEAT repeat protein
LIDEIIGNRLASDSYEDIAQAILLSAFLMERERCPALVALLEHPNPEVNIRAGWALQELADSEEVMASMLPHVERITEKLSTAGTATIDEINRLAYLLEVFGRNRYEPVVELLMLYVPKNDFRMGTVSRTSAIWSLGKIYEGKKNANLAKQLAARLLDDHPIFPEEDLVKYSSALAMGRIGDPSSPDRLLEAGIQGDSPIALACRWAMEQYNKPDTNAQ